MDFAEARFEVAENFFTGGADQRFRALLGEFAELLEISFADAFHARERRVDGFIEMLGQRVLNDFFSGCL